MSAPTHDRGGLLDVVVSRDDLPAPPVDIIDVGLSDHQLLRWTAPLVRPPPVYTTAVRRPWNRLDADAFRAGLRTSLLCQTDAWSTLHVDGLAQLYNSEITMLLDQLIPARSVTYRRRPSDPWFDDEAARLNARLGNSSAPFIEPRRVTRLLLPLRKLRSVVTMPRFVGGNAKRSSGTKSTSKARIHVNCGDPSML